MDCLRCTCCNFFCCPDVCVDGNAFDRYNGRNLVVYADFVNLVVARCLVMTLPSSKQVELDAHGFTSLVGIRSIEFCQSVRQKPFKPGGDSWRETCDFKQYEYDSAFEFWIICLLPYIVYCTTEMSKWWYKWVCTHYYLQNITTR